jgi:hypothetical protein
MNFWDMFLLPTTGFKKATFGGFSTNRSGRIFPIGDKWIILVPASMPIAKKKISGNTIRSPISGQREQTFGGTARHGATGFVIGSKGYIGTGYTPEGLKNDFWEYTTVISSCTAPTKFIGNKTLYPHQPN